jgi:alcohol dehydrogenase class IV
MSTILPLARLHMFHLPKKVIFGLDAVKELGAEASALGSRCLLITDRGIIGSGLLERVKGPLSSANVEIVLFDRIAGEPTIKDTEEIFTFARSESFDFVVGLGGGSVLDMAKVASIAATNPGSVKDYLGINLVRKPGKPKILIPTTAGTSAEVTVNAVVAIPEEETKSAIVTPYNLADVAIIDPALTLTLPQKITVSSGLDVLSHAVEALMSTGSNPITDTLAYEAIELVSKNLRLAYAQPDNINARYCMSLASLSAGIAFSNAGVCIGHGAAYTFAVTHSVPHGLSCGLALPYVMEYNAIACPDKLSKVYEIIGGESGLSLIEDARRAALAVKSLLTDLGAPLTLKDVGVPKKALPEMADRLLKNKRLLSRNPRTISKEEAVKLFERMWEG